MKQLYLPYILCKKQISTCRRAVKRFFLPYILRITLPLKSILPIFIDAFFCGSIFLLFFRLFFRLFFHWNPYWQLNFLCFFLFTTIQLRYNILEIIRENYIVILKKLLGRNYWYTYTNQEVSSIHKWTPNIFEDITRSNIIFQQIYIFLIVFRLWVFKFTFSFIFFICIFNIFLIFNKYLIFSSFFSLFLLLSRLTIFATDYTKKEFFEEINLIERIKKNENIKPTWENGILIGLVVSRSFSNRKKHKEYYMEDYYTKRHELTDIIHSKYIQLKSGNLGTYKDREDAIDWEWRYLVDIEYKESYGRLGEPYTSIIEKETR